MSGGSYNYGYQRIIELANDIEARVNHNVDKYGDQVSPVDPDVSALRLALVAHLRVVAEAARMIEWVDSSDCAPRDEIPAIMAALRKGENHA